MEPLKLNIAVPFRLDGTSEEHPGCLKHFTAYNIRSYLDALEADIAASSLETEDFQVTEIEFVNGSFTHLGTGSLKRIADCIKKHFNVHPNVKYILGATPSGLDFFTLTEAKQLGNSSIVIDCPAVTDAGLKAAGFNCSADAALTALDSAFQNGFHRFAVVISPALCPNSSSLVQTVKTVLSKNPAQVRFATSLEGEFASAAEYFLVPLGYRRAGKSDIWYRGDAPEFKYFPNQIGCGPHAMSVFDGQGIFTTADFDFYCAHSSDFEALVTHGA